MGTRTLLVGTIFVLQLLQCVFGSSAEAEHLETVKVTQGTLRGRRVTSKSGGVFFSFQGVPYAKPPVGPLRFKVAQTPELWDGVKDALKEGPSCPQIDILWRRSYMGEEDCLYLNIYTPKLESANGSLKYPVMVWIHGGAFVLGSGDSDIYGPDYLVGENVVLVTINYRLGILGFMVLEDESVPRNLGLKDQAEALRWVQENIENFGGDPAQVTIFGESAGASCVHYHMMSPMSKGLFHKAIAQSGCVLNLRASADEMKQITFQVAKELGGAISHSEELLKFLKSIPARNIVEAYTKVNQQQSGRQIRTFGPTVETEVNANDIFTTTDAQITMEKGRFHNVPSIFGFNSGEGILGLMFSGLLENPSSIKYVGENFESLIPKELTSRGSRKDVAEKIRKLYFGNKMLSEITLTEYADFLTDASFGSGVDKTVKLLAANSQIVYYYHFAFDGKNNIYKKLLNASHISGASHGDDISYLFRMTLVDNEAKPETPEWLTRKRMVKLWTNFAKTGNPTPKTDTTIGVQWPAYTTDDQAYLNIDAILDVRRNLNKERMELWHGGEELWMKQRQEL